MGNKISKTESNSLKCSIAVHNKSRSTPGGSEIVSGTSSQRGVPEPNTDICGPEANLHEHITCRKHPGHKDFIPVGKFRKEHLPEEYRSRKKHSEIFGKVKALCDLTVHLKVRTVSKDRPKYYPDSTDAYPFHIPGGGSRTRTGSGWVNEMYKCGEGSERYRDQTCECDECETSQSPVKKWWELRVVTAAHVVCDTTEAKDAEVTLFYDDDDKDSETFAAKGRTVERVDIEGDRCLFTVIVHNDGVCERLYKSLNYCPSRMTRLYDISFVISHPHGCSKHITFAYNYHWDSWNDETYFRHNASTCPGSSGGLVLGGDSYWEMGYSGWLYPHSEAMPDGTSRCGAIWHDYNLQGRV